MKIRLRFHIFSNYYSLILFYYISSFPISYFSFFLSSLVRIFRIKWEWHDIFEFLSSLFYILHFIVFFFLLLRCISSFPFSFIIQFYWFPSFFFMKAIYALTTHYTNFKAKFHFIFIVYIWHFFSLLLFSLHFCVSFHFLCTASPLPFSHFCLPLLTHKSFLPHSFNSFYYSATSSCSSRSLFLCFLVSSFCILFPLFPKIAVILYLPLSRTLCRFYFPFDL